MFRKVMMLLTVALLLVVTATLAALGADPAPVAAAPVAAVASPGTFDVVISWFLGHQVALGLMLMAIIDFIYSINPEWKSNSALHFIYLFTQKLAGKSAPPAA